MGHFTISVAEVLDQAVPFENIINAPVLILVALNRRALEILPARLAPAYAAPFSVAHVGRDAEQPVITFDTNGKIFSRPAHPQAVAFERNALLMPVADIAVVTVPIFATGIAALVRAAVIPFSVAAVIALFRWRRPLVHEKITADAFHAHHAKTDHPRVFPAHRPFRRSIRTDAPVHVRVTVLFTIANIAVISAVILRFASPLAVPAADSLPRRLAELSARHIDKPVTALRRPARPLNAYLPGLIAADRPVRTGLPEDAEALDRADFRSVARIPIVALRAARAFFGKFPVAGFNGNFRLHGRVNIGVSRNGIGRKPLASRNDQA